MYKHKYKIILSESDSSPPLEPHLERLLIYLRSLGKVYDPQHGLDEGNMTFLLHTNLDTEGVKHALSALGYAVAIQTLGDGHDFRQNNIQALAE